jgi:hypothetical protein
MNDVYAVDCVAIGHHREDIMFVDVTGKPPGCTGDPPKATIRGLLTKKEAQRLVALLQLLVDSMPDE